MPRDRARRARTPQGGVRVGLGGWGSAGGAQRAARNVQAFTCAPGACVQPQCASASVAGMEARRSFHTSAARIALPGAARPGVARRHLWPCSCCSGAANRDPRQALSPDPNSSPVPRAPEASARVGWRTGVGSPVVRQWVPLSSAAEAGFVDVTRNFHENMQEVVDEMWNGAEAAGAAMKNALLPTTASSSSMAWSRPVVRKKIMKERTSEEGRVHHAIRLEHGGAWRRHNGLERDRQTERGREQAMWNKCAAGEAQGGLYWQRCCERSWRGEER